MIAAEAYTIEHLEPIRAQSMLPVIDATSLAGKSVPPRHWQVEPLIPCATVTGLSGDGGMGKSTLALQLCVSTVAGRPWLGMKVKRGAAFYVSAEDDKDELHRRLAGIVHSGWTRFEDLKGLALLSLAGKDAVLAAPEKSGLLKPTTLFADLRAEIDRQRPALLVLDTLADLFGGDEIKKIEARQFITMLRGLAIEFDMAVLLLSHPSQAGMNTGAGTSGNVAWSNSVRSRLYFEREHTNEGKERDPDIRILSLKKANYAPAGAAVRVRYEKGAFVPIDAPGSDSSSELLREARDVFMELIRTFEREGRSFSPEPSVNYAPKVFAEHPHSRKIGKNTFKKAMEQLFAESQIKVVTIGSPSRQRKNIVIV